MLDIKGKPKAIIFDLDGTLCQLNSHLEPYNHTVDDQPITSMKYLYDSI
jgi:FMN phosphatase YigB (HAD superfamily)